MFFYFYDTFVTQSKYSALLNQIESRIIELGINGRVEKLTPLRNMKELLESGLKQGAHTVVVLGNDSTMFRTINIIAQHNQIALGYIPFPDVTPLSTLLGITSTLDACNILSRRITTVTNLAKANQTYFLGALALTEARCAKIKCDDKFDITCHADINAVSVSNLGKITELPKLENVHSKQQKLLLEIQPKKIKAKFLSKQVVPQVATKILANKIIINHVEQPLAVLLDNEITLKTPVTITLKPKQLKLIVGKNRLIR
jgi:diacylglycerol kinase family enzyme